MLVLKTVMGALGSATTTKQAVDPIDLSRDDKPNYLLIVVAIGGFAVLAIVLSQILKSK